MWDTRHCALYSEPNEDSAELSVGDPSGVAAALGLPTAVVTPTHDDNPDRLIDEAVGRILDLFGAPWADHADERSLQLNPLVLEAVGRIEEQLSGCVPAFLEADGPVTLVVTPMAAWMSDPRSARIRMCAATRVGLLALAEAGQGMRRWAAVAARIATARVETELQIEALERLRSGEASEEDARRAHRTMARLGYSRVFNSPPPDRDEVLRRALASRSMLLLIDEPEAHLHETAQEDVAAWLVEESYRNTSVLLATHSPHFLRIPTELARYHRVERQDWVAATVPSVGPDSLAPHPSSVFSRIRDITEDLNTELQDHAQGLGFSDAAWLMASRALVYVEGRHDLLILEHFRGRELRRLGLQAYALHGGKRAFAIAESELVAGLGMRLLFVFDNVRAEVVGDAEFDQLSDEEKLATGLLGLREQGRDVRVVPYHVICAIRPSTLVRVYPHVTSSQLDELVTDDAWGPAVELFRESGSPTSSGGCWSTVSVAASPPRKSSRS